MRTRPASAPVRGTRSLSAAEIVSFLQGQEWGVLSVAASDGPYAVPVSFGMSGGRIVIATGPGRKLDALLADPRACLTVSAVRGGDDWTCVVARGSMLPIEDLLSRARALRALARGAVPLTPATLRRAGAATLFRLDPLDLSGRTRTA